MYLFGYDKDSVRLLDIIGDEFVSAHGLLQFVSDYPGKPEYGHELTVGSTDTPVWVIKERDGRGNPLVRIKLYHDPFDYGLYKFYTDRGIDADKYEELHLYVKIQASDEGGARRKAGRDKRAARLRVALDPEIYRPLFDSIRGMQKAGVRPAGYYVYGFLAGRFDLSHIRADLGDNKLRRYIVDMLEEVGKWDAAAHDRSEPVPRIVEYKFKRR
jgi:hypothetical protein